MSTLPPPTFGLLLRRARRVAGLSQEALAERVGLSVDAISALEREHDNLRAALGWAREQGEADRTSRACV